MTASAFATTSALLRAGLSLEQMRDLREAWERVRRAERLQSKYRHLVTHSEEAIRANAAFSEKAARVLGFVGDEEDGDESR